MYMIFSDEIINIILSFREKHPIAYLLEPLIRQYMEIGPHLLLEYYHDNEYYEYSFVEWVFE